jgi:hypothetical protein
MDISSGNVHLSAYGKTQAADIALCKDISDILNRHYPNHPWMVGCNHEAGDLYIQLAYPSRIGHLARHGYRIHMACSQDLMKKKVMRAGGELLERWKLPREKANSDSYAKAKSNGLITTGEKHVR